MPRPAPVAPSSWHPPFPWGSDSGHRLTSLPRTVPQLDVPSWRSSSSHGHPDTSSHQLWAPRPKLPIMIVPAGDLRPKAFGRSGLPCPSTTRRGGTQAPRDKNLSEPLEARTTASPSRLPWAETAAEVTPCCPPPGDHWGSTPQGSSPLPQIQIHAISINTYPQGCRMGASSISRPGSMAGWLRNL